MTHTSERRRTCWKLQVRAQPGVEQNGLWTWHARQLPFLPGHSNSIRTPFCIGALVYAAHAADIPVENGKLNKVHSGSSDRTKARSGISSGMIYLTRSVLIRAYYMRDREPRSAAPQPSAVWPYASTYHLPAVRFGSSHRARNRALFSFYTVSLCIEVTIKLQKKKNRAKITQKNISRIHSKLYQILNNTFCN